MRRETVDLQEAAWKLFPLFGIRILWPENVDIEKLLQQDKCIVEIEIPDYDKEK